MEYNNPENINGFRRKSKKRKKKKKLLIFIILLVLWNLFFGFAKVKKDATFTIESGSNVFEIAEKLEDEGIITKKAKFVVTVITSGNRGKLNYGSFEFKKGMSYTEIIEMMVNGGAKKETLTLTIPEGFSVENIIDRMAEKKIGTREEIEKALLDEYDYAFIEHIPEKDGQKYKLQGFLFPSTYEFFADATPHEVVDRMLSEFEKQYPKDDYTDVYEVITKASMVEREAKIDSERATIAGVFENRISKDMRLQIDATVAYVISDGKYDVQRVLYKDLENDSPYNTYKYKGLPVGPIANPGLESIEAALNPEKHDYLYYHTDEEKKDGSHIFTKTLDEHNKTTKGR